MSDLQAHHCITLESGADPATKFRRWRFQKYLAVKSHYEFITARDMKHSLQHCFDKTMVVKMALHRECCFPNCTKSC